MKRFLSILAFGSCLSIQAHAIINSVSSGDVTLGNHFGNLITNGSFEADNGFAANGSYWATGTTLTPTMSLTGWTASGVSQSYARWGSDFGGILQGSAPIPHGASALYFGGGIGVGVSPFPTINPVTGITTFSSAPTITPKPTTAPVTLSQTLTGLSTSTQYRLDFWASGEHANTGVFQQLGFFGLDITGENTLYFASPTGNGPLGQSQRYYVYFTPSSSTVSLTFTNWGHFFNGNGDLSTEVVLDDVILNPVPEPATLASLATALVLLRKRRRLS